MKKYLVPITLTAVGVVVALLAIKWGDDNDVPLLTDAADLF